MSKRIVKCQITKEKGPADSFFKAPNGKYYKTEALYLNQKHQYECRCKCISLICDYAHYDSEKIAPTFLFKMLSEFGEKVGYDILLDTITEYEDSFLWANDNKEFKNEVGRLLYYKSIISNHIIDVYKKAQNEKVHQKLTEQAPEIDIEEAKNIGCSVGKGKDISGLVGDFFDGIS